jgi:hypothetical protein
MTSGAGRVLHAVSNCRLLVQTRSDSAETPAMGPVVALLGDCEPERGRR